MFSLEYWFVADAKLIYYLVKIKDSIYIFPLLYIISAQIIFPGEEEDFRRRTFGRRL